MSYERITDIREVVSRLGRADIAAAVGVQTKTITPYVKSGKFPASWYLVLQKMASEQGMYLPVDMFAMKD